MGWHTCVSSSDSSVVGRPTMLFLCTRKTLRFPKAPPRPLQSPTRSNDTRKKNQHTKEGQRSLNCQRTVRQLDPHQMTIGRFNKFKIGFSTSCLTLVKPIKPIRTRFTFGNKNGNIEINRWFTFAQNQLFNVHSLKQLASDLYVVNTNVAVASSRKTSCHNYGCIANAQ